MNTRFPTHREILSALAAGSKDRLFAGAHDPSRFTRHSAALDAAEARIRDALGKPIPPIPWSKFRLFLDTGDRSEAERPYFQRRSLLADLAVLLLAGRDPDGAYTALLEDLLWEICNEYTWSLPAHLLRSNAGVDGNRPDRITLDLFSTETGFYIAEILHFLGDHLAPRLVARCHAEVKERVLDSYLGDYNVYWWEHGVNNWAAVCAGSIGGAFLYEEPDPHRREKALVRVIDTMEMFIDSFPADGTCEEGPGYWGYGFGYFTMFAELLYEYTAGTLNLFDNPDVHAIALFPQSIRLSETRAASFADGGRFFRPPVVYNAVFCRHYPDATPACGTLGPGGSTKLSAFLRAFVEADPAVQGAALPDATSYLPDAQWLVVRRAPFAFAALFGNNGVSHNHNDIGTFLLVDGDREGPMDLGSGIYTRQYFGPERYGDEILCCGSQGHSVPIVGGARQKAGRAYAARDVRFEDRPDGTVAFSGDIAGAYDLPALRSLRRAFTIRPADGAMDLQDDIAFDGSITERFIGYEKPEIVAPGEVRFGVFIMRFDSTLVATVTALPFQNHGAGNGSLGEAGVVYALDIVLPAGASEFRSAFVVCRNGRE